MSVVFSLAGEANYICFFIQHNIWGCPNKRLPTLDSLDTPDASRRKGHALKAASPFLEVVRFQAHHRLSTTCGGLC